MKSRTYLYAALTTTFNIILNALTLGRFLWLEGRVRKGIFRNWARRFAYAPQRFVQPTTEQEIIALVRQSGGVRLFGSAHSFNDGVVSDEILVSLDKYCGVVDKPAGDKQMTFKAGARLRDVIATLLDNGLAFCALPSHDAQSIGGILSTDVHGTGKNWGFVSECVVALRIIDGNGTAHDCVPQDDLYRAAIGGVGAVGIIAEVTVQGVDRFNVEQRFEVSSLAFVKNNLERLLAENDHLSLYLFPFTDKCQISKWNRTERGKTFLGPLWEFLSISADALLSVWVGNLMAYSGLLPKASDTAHGFKKGTNLVLESNKAFNRTIYHLHQEMEFTVPFEQTFEMCELFLNLYQQMYSKDLPYTLLEVRFTPPGHNRTLIGAGRERRSTWIDLICNDSHGFEAYYDAAEQLIKEIGARPHLGKFCRSFKMEDMRRIHGQNFEKFLELVKTHDPQNKFGNDFTRRLFTAESGAENGAG